jgi:diguanylate cyclase (GGDEF)-like protein
VTVALVDLDQFKLINDSFGHQLGDALLQTIAERLKGCVRDSDTVGRQGGDEFVLVLRNYADDGELTSIMQRIQTAIAAPWSAGRRELQVTCSIGIAVYPQDGRSADVLLRNADSAMYKAKENGRNNYQFYTAELNRVIFERLSVERRLRSALVRKQFVLHYQPRVNISTGRIVAAEALLRWRAPQGGLYRPARFIGVAENTGLIVPIGKWVLRTACDQARSWQIQGLRSIMVSVNVSPRQFGKRHGADGSRCTGAERSCGPLSAARAHREHDDGRCGKYVRCCASSSSSACSWRWMTLARATRA